MMVYQTLTTAPLPAGRLSEPFFFLGFLGSRLERFCSLLATRPSVRFYADTMYYCRLISVSTSSP